MGGKRYAVNRNVIIFVTVLLVVTSLVMALVYVMDDHMAGEVLEPIL